MTMSAAHGETNTRRGDSLRHWCWGVYCWICGRRDILVLYRSRYWAAPKRSAGARHTARRALPLPRYARYVCTAKHSVKDRKEQWY